MRMAHRQTAIQWCNELPWGYARSKGQTELVPNDVAGMGITASQYRNHTGTSMRVKALSASKLATAHSLLSECTEAIAAPPPQT